MNSSELIKNLGEWLDEHEPRLIDQIPQTYRPIKEKPPILLAVSGGVDSMVLLDGFHQLFKKRKRSLSVIHINHHLRQASEAEQEMVIQFCEARDIDLKIVEWHHDDPADPNRSELAAREFRYAVFKRIMQITKSPYLVTAHHQNDQAETVLMRLVHGGRLTSIAGIHPVRPIQLDEGLKTGFVLRPLLHTPKADLYAYAEENQIPYQEDESNLDLTYTRNRFRQEIIPSLEKEDANLLDHLADFAQAAQANVSFAQQYMNHVLKSCVIRNADTWQIDLASLREFDQPQQVLLWQRLFDQSKIDQLSSFSQSGFHQMVVFLNQDTGQGEWQLPGDYRLVKVYDTAYLLHKETAVFGDQTGKQKLESQQVDQPIQLSIDQWVALGDQREIGLFKFDQRDQEGKVVTGVDQAVVNDLKIRHRQSGDWIQLANGHSQKLNRYFINEKIPSDIRDQALILVDKNQMVWGVLYQGDVLYSKDETGQLKVILKFV